MSELPATTSEAAASAAHIEAHQDFSSFAPARPTTLPRTSIVEGPILTDVESGQRFTRDCI